MNNTRHTRPQILALIGWLALCFSAAGTGAFVSIGGWYDTLNKPSWNPPSWIFGPVWSLLYIMMAVAAWLVWKKGGWAAQRKALSLFVAQLLLNALWTPLFFALHKPGLAFIEIVILWIMVVATIREFKHVHQTAARLLMPYLAWITFAAVLNFAIWRLNSV